MADATAIAVGAQVGWLNVDQGMAEAGVGLIVCASVPIPIASSNELWFRALGVASRVSYWSEIDAG